MPELPAHADAMFPALDDAQLARLSAFGQQGQAEASTVLFDLGDAAHGVFVVLAGSIEIAGISRDESEVRVLTRGMFTGEVNQLSEGGAWSDADARGEFDPEIARQFAASLRIRPAPVTSSCAWLRRPISSRTPATPFDGSDHSADTPFEALPATPIRTLIDVSAIPISR
jgi:CRP-like cAMP-binding protein